MTTVLASASLHMVGGQPDLLATVCVYSPDGMPAVWNGVRLQVSMFPDGTAAPTTAQRWDLPAAGGAIPSGGDLRLDAMLPLKRVLAGGQYDVQISGPTAPIPVEVAGRAETAAIPLAPNMIGTVAVAIPTPAGASWTGTIRDGASGSTGWDRARLTQLSCGPTGCTASFTLTSPHFDFALTGPTTVETARGTSLTVIGNGAGGGGFADGLYSASRQVDFGPVPAGTSALRFDLVTGPGFVGSTPVHITVVQPLGG